MKAQVPSLKFVVAGYGSRGDVEPFAAVARELRGRGHDVCLAVSPWMIGFVESAGLAAVPLARRSSPPRNPRSPTIVVRRVMQMWSEWAAAYKTLASEGDLLLTGKGEQGLAANVADYHGIPHASLHFYPGDYATLGGVIGALPSRPKTPNDANWAYRTTPQPKPWRSRPTTSFASPGRQPNGRSRAGGGPSSGPDAGVADARRRRGLVVDRRGNAADLLRLRRRIQFPSPAETAAIITAACTQLGERALIVGGANDMSQVPAADHVKIVGGVNHAVIFPACRAVVHHGGAGTTAAGMRAGVPTLILWIWTTNRYGQKPSPGWESAQAAHFRPPHWIYSSRTCARSLLRNTPPKPAR